MSRKELELIDPRDNLVREADELDGIKSKIATMFQQSHAKAKKDKDRDNNRYWDKFNRKYKAEKMAANLKMLEVSG